MRWREPFTLTVKVLSPVAIGTGERCNALGFLVDGNSVLVIDERLFIAALTDGQRDLFLRWLEPLIGKLAHLREQIQRARDNQQLRNRLNQERRQVEVQLSLGNFLREILKMPQPAQWLRHTAKAVCYEVPALLAPNRYEGFALCLKTPDHRPYIPGSELKGALRTAVLTQMLLQDPNALSNLGSRLSNLSKQLANASQRQIQRGLTNCWQSSEWALLRAGRQDAHYDLFRGVAISDSEPLSREALRIYAAKRLGMSRDVSMFVEAIAPGSETTVTLSIASPDRWLEVMELTDKAGWLDWEKLANALYEHANAVLDFVAQKFPQMSQCVQRLKSQNKPDAPLVRIGWGQGFLSVTMTDPLRRSSPNDYELLRQVMAKAISQYGRTKSNNFPKTLWAALDSNGNPSDLFGWVKLIPQRR